MKMKHLALLMAICLICACNVAPAQAKEPSISEAKIQELSEVYKKGFARAQQLRKQLDTQNRQLIALEGGIEALRMIVAEEKALAEKEAVEAAEVVELIEEIKEHVETAIEVAEAPLEEFEEKETE